MNEKINEFLERLKEDRILQLIIGIFLVSIILLIILLKPFLFPKRQETGPCYQTTLTLWLPYSEYQLYSYLTDFTKYCVDFKIITKSLEDIKRSLFESLAVGNYPSIVFIDNEFLTKNKDIFATYTPITVDSLVAYYNENILKFLNLTKPKTLDELKNFINGVRSYRSDIYPIGLGTTDVRNRREIVLSLTTLGEEYRDKTRFPKNFRSALETYRNFSNPLSDYFSYPYGLGDDLTNFAQEKLVIYLGFYKDKDLILKLNPKINFSLAPLPLNTFPPKLMSYTKIYYLANPKEAESEAAKQFISWFANSQLLNFSKDFDLIPFKENVELDKNKEVVFNVAKNFGETFDFLNKELLFENFDSLFNYFENDYEFYRLFEPIRFSL